MGGPRGDDDEDEEGIPSLLGHISFTEYAEPRSGADLIGRRPMGFQAPKPRVRVKAWTRWVPK